MSLILFVFLFVVKRDSSTTNPKRLEVVFSRRRIKRNHFSFIIDKKIFRFLINDKWYMENGK